MLLNTVTPLDDFPISAVLESLRRVTNDLINIGSGTASAALVRLLTFTHSRRPEAYALLAPFTTSPPHQ